MARRRAAAGVPAVACAFRPVVNSVAMQHVHSGALWKKSTRIWLVLAVLTVKSPFCRVFAKFMAAARWLFWLPSRWWFVLPL